MRVGPYELQIVNKNGVALAEREIAGANYAEAVAGQEYKVKATIYKGSSAIYPLPAAVLYFSIDGKRLSEHFQQDFGNVATNLWSCVFPGFPLGGQSFNAFVFSDPEPVTGQSNAKSSTGCITVQVYEAVITEVMVPRVVTHPAIPKAAPDSPEQKPPPQTPKAANNPAQLVDDRQTENNKPLEKPSLKTCPGRTFSLAAPRPPPPPANTSARSDVPPSSAPASAASPPAPSLPEVEVKKVWRLKRAEPDATLEIRCHTADTLDFLEAFHKDRADRIAGYRVPVDLAAAVDVKPEIKTETSVPSAAASGPSTVPQNAPVFDLTKMDTSTMDLTVEVEPRAEVEFIAGSAAPGQTRKKTKKAAEVKVKAESSASGTLPPTVKPTKRTTKPAVKTAVKAEPGAQPAKKAKKTHVVPATTAPATVAAPAPATAVPQPEPVATTGARLDAAPASTD